MKKKIAMFLALAMTAATVLTGCGDKTMKYAVEAGSAGESVAKEKGFEINSVLTQADALMEVASGTSDAAIIDLLMAGAMIGEGTNYADLVIAKELAGEEYGVGFRQGSDLIESFNAFYKAAYEDGTVMACAETYGIAKNIIAK